MQVSLFASHPLILERLRLQLIRPHLEVHAYLIKEHDRTDGVEPVRSGAWVIDAHDPSLLEKIRLAWPNARPCWVVTAEAFDDAAAFHFLFSGVRGLVRYDRLAAELVRAIEAIQAGAYWVPRLQMAHFVDHILARFPHPEHINPAITLSPRERQVMNEILCRASNKEIAARLGLSERTVKFHVSNLLKKFGVETRHDLAWRLFGRSAE